MKRTESIDLLRGFIMILMAIDHASAMIARVHFSEMWGVAFETYDSFGWWFTRFVSHLCAPGFFFLMGMSMYLFAEKRLKSSWTHRQIYSYFIKRGTLILAFMIFLELPAWAIGMSASEVPSSSPLPGTYSGGFLFPTTVLYGLGMCMIIGGFLWKLKDWQLLSISVIGFILSGWYITGMEPIQAFHPVQHLLIVPGMSSGTMSLYPIIPWIGVTTFGLFWAQLLIKKQASIYNISLKIGLSFIALFIGLRFSEWGNFQYTENENWIQFFTLIKYPPSVSFILITCGINLILLYVFSRIEGRNWLKPILLFGQTAMFFYILHLHLYSLIGLAFPRGSSIWTMYLLWLLGLVLLYFVCKWFLTFKRNKPIDSFWRMV